MSTIFSIGQMNQLATALENGVIRFSVTSDGTTGPEWIKWFDTNGYRLDSDVRALLKSDKFKPTKGVTYPVCVLKGERYEDRDRVTKTIRADAEKQKFPEPPLELACLIRKMFTNEQVREMGLYWIIIMHEAVNLSGDLHLLDVSCYGDDRWLAPDYDNPDDEWDRKHGFAFLTEQVSST
ncbi:MAG: hypothetical protein AAB340_02665 [Patescibacteria group bacterium]